MSTPKSQSKANLKSESGSESSSELKPCGIPFTIDLLYPRYWLTWVGLGFSFILSLLPVFIRHALGKGLGRVIYRYNHKRRHIVVTNLKIAFPDLSTEQVDAKALSSLQWYSRAMIDYSILFFSSAKELDRLIRVEGQENVNQAIDNKENVIILLMHSVWLDFAPAGLGVEYSVYGSYKPVKNRLLDWIMSKSRCRHVDFVIAREEGMVRLVRALQPGRLLIFLPDEDLGISHAEFAPFFGEDKATLNTPARIAKLKSATCFLCYTYYDEETREYCVKLEDSLSAFPNENAIKSAGILNQSMENMIKNEPEQYMWLLKHYKTRPQGEVSIY